MSIPQRSTKVFHRVAQRCIVVYDLFNSYYSFNQDSAKEINYLEIGIFEIIFGGVCSKIKSKVFQKFLFVVCDNN